MSERTPLNAKSDEELHLAAKACGRNLVLLGAAATLYAVFLLYSAASGNWNWWMGAAVVPLLLMIVGLLFPMTQLAMVQQELARRQGNKQR